MSNLFKKEAGRREITFGSRITRNPFCPASYHFSALHRMLIQSLKGYYNQKQTVGACPASLLPQPLLITELGFFGHSTDFSDSTTLGPLQGSILRTCLIFPKPFLCFRISCPYVCLLYHPPPRRCSGGAAGRGMRNTCMGNPQIQPMFPPRGKMHLSSHKVEGKPSLWKEGLIPPRCQMGSTRLRD